MNNVSELNRFSSRLSEVRNSLGLNIASFARGLDVPRSTLVGWEEGKSVSIEILSTLSNRYGISIDWFLTGKGDMFLPGWGKEGFRPTHDGTAIHDGRMSYGDPAGRSDDFPQGPAPPVDSIQRPAAPVDRLRGLSAEIMSVADELDGLPAGAPLWLRPFYDGLRDLDPPRREKALEYINLLKLEQGQSPQEGEAGIA